MVASAEKEEEEREDEGEESVLASALAKPAS
jgi:hypothetical protein